LFTTLITSQWITEQFSGEEALHAGRNKSGRRAQVQRLVDRGVALKLIRAQDAESVRMLFSAWLLGLSVAECVRALSAEQRENASTQAHTSALHAAQSSVNSVATAHTLQRRFTERSTPELLTEQERTEGEKHTKSERKNEDKSEGKKEEEEEEEEEELDAFSENQEQLRSPVHWLSVFRRVFTTVAGPLAVGVCVRAESAFEMGQQVESQHGEELLWRMSLDAHATKLLNTVMVGFCALLLSIPLAALCISFGGFPSELVYLLPLLIALLVALAYYLFASTVPEAQRQAAQAAALDDRVASALQSAVLASRRLLEEGARTHAERHAKEERFNLRKKNL
jgi:hypothetical protein